MPAPLKRSPARAVRKLDSTRALLAFQRTLKDALIRPLAPNDRTQRRWIDGRPMAEFAADYIKPNDRLTALERLEIYNRMYWFRLLDCFHDDNPGLRALLGPRRFTRLAEAYIAKYPSSSYTLRNLCSRLAPFIRAEPRWTAPHTALAFDIARFEWAQTVAFDEPGRSVLAATDLATVKPSRLRLGLQPYITLLELNHPADTYVIAVKRRDALRPETSNASTAARSAEREKRVPRPRRERTRLAVHRIDNQLYYKRLEAPAFRMLAALRDGCTLTAAIAAGGRRGVTPEKIREWFAVWTELGWFFRRK